MRLKRRSFMSTLGGASLPLYPPRSRFRGLAGKNPRVLKPGRGAEYTKRLLKELCTDLGPRPAGSKACVAGSKIIAGS